MRSDVLASLAVGLSVGYVLAKRLNEPRDFDSVLSDLKGFVYGQHLREETTVYLIGVYLNLKAHQKR